MRVGMIGLGTMGRPMAGHVVAAGHPLVVFGRSPASTAPLVEQGARALRTPAEVAAESEVILLCVSDPAAVRDVVTGPGGVAEGLAPGAIVVDHSTVDVATNRLVAEAAQAKGAQALDAPISGGVTGAERGTLTVMTGGPADAFERALPVLETYGKRVVHVGDVGSGTIVKLVNQMLIGINMAAAAEAYRIVRKLDVDPELVLDIIGSSTGDSAALKRARQSFLAEDYAPQFRMNLLIKDLGLATGLGRSLGAGVPLTEGALALYEAARDAGHGDDDVTAVVTVDQAGSTTG